MDTNSKDSEPPETKESAVKNAENATFILGNETPQNHVAEATPNPCTPDTFKLPSNFSTVTAEQLRTKTESSVKNSSGKLSSYLKKSRRRSTVGLRGSPETNSLIRFIAQRQNLKNVEKSPLTQNSAFLGSRVLYRNVNSLKERMSAFQLAFHSLNEEEKMTGRPGFSEAAEKLETTGLSKNESLGECQQSEFPAQLSKHQGTTSRSNSDENPANAIDLQIVNIDALPNTGRTCAVAPSLADLCEESSESDLKQSGYLVEESVPLSELTEASSGMQVADHIEGRGPADAVSPDDCPAVSTGTAPGLRSPVTPLCERDTPAIALRSVLKKPSIKLCLESLQEHCDNLCDNGTHPSLISNLTNFCREQKAEGQENYKVPIFINMKKRKRVTFGEDLSPEVFDESLPANTPLRKGETPVRKKDLSSASPLLFEQSPVSEPLPQPNFDDKGENLENIEPLQVSFAVPSPLSKSSVSETLSGTDTYSSSNNQEKISSCKRGRRTRTSNRRTQLSSFSEESVCSLLNTEAQPCKENKSKRRKCQESEHTDRTLPKKSRVLKSCRKKKAKRKKGVDKSLYKGRDFASKKPLLSPIAELPEVSEMSPSVPRVQRMYSDEFSSSGELEEMKLPERKTLLPQNSEDLQMNQDSNKYDVSEFCSSYIKSSFPLVNAAFDQDSNISTIEIHENKNIPKAESQLESENGLKTGTRNENSPISYASLIKKPIVAENPKSNFILQSQEFSAGCQHGVNVFQSFKISEDIKCEKQDDFLVATEGNLLTKSLKSDSQKEDDYPEDVLIAGLEGNKSQSEGLGRNSMESSSGLSCERKHRRCSVCYSGGQSFHLENSGNHKPSCGVDSSVELSLEKSELCKELSDAIEQTFQRTNSETKVRRSSRLQKDLENEGLVWISLPFPSNSYASQSTKRRTVWTFDSTGFESMSPRKKIVSSRPKSGIQPSISGQENSEKFATDSLRLPGRRRKSFCTSALTNTENTKSKRDRRTSLNQKRESSLK
ncbi:cell division cycle-associated protein 2 isoform X2 [Pteropus medius]|nr:cell division cycle-associated protein 2 isoform X2 [Pteropus giganteus]